MDPRIIMRSLKANSLMMGRMFGTPASVGICLMDAHYRDCPWMTVQELAREAMTSPDTARRRLRELVGAGRVFTRREGTRDLYRVCPALADRIISKLDKRTVGP